MARQREFDSLVSVVHADVLDAPSGLTPRQIGERLGFPRYTTFMNQLEQQPGFKFDANLVIPIQLLCGSKRALHHQASRQGSVVIDLPQAVPGMEPLSLQAIQTVKEVGDVMGEFHAAASDGVITPTEKRRVRDKVYSAISALVAFGTSLEDA